MNPSPRPSRPAAPPCGTHPAPAPALTMLPGSPPVADADPVPPVRRALPDMLPDSLRESTFARLDPNRAPEAYRACRIYADHGQHQGRLSLLLVGRKGAGKSSLAAAILHQVVAQAQDPHHARFWPLRRSLQAIRETRGQPPAQRLYLADLVAQPLSILDQVEGPASLWEAHHLEVLLPLLWDEQRQVVVTTDLALDEVKEALGSVWIWEMFRVCHVVCVGG